jgi:hypothetical protein
MLLQGESAHVHVIEQPPWLHLGECGHPGESVVLTLAGEWVVSSQGERHHLTPGSIFWFGSETVAGFEVPFFEPATILFFKSEKPRESPETFVEFLVENTNVTEEQYENRSYPTFDNLPPDHPAIEFAR